MIDAVIMNQTFSPDLKQIGNDAKGREAKTSFLGHVLSTMLEEMVPKQGYLEDPNTQLFFSMYFAEMMEDEGMIESLGLGEELHG